MIHDLFLYLVKCFIIDYKYLYQIIFRMMTKKILIRNKLKTNLHLDLTLQLVHLAPPLVHQGLGQGLTLAIIDQTEVTQGQDHLIETRQNKAIRDHDPGLVIAVLSEATPDRGQGNGI